MRPIQAACSGIPGRQPRYYRLLYNLGSLAMFIWVMASYRTSPVLYFAPGIWSLVMYAAQVIVAAVLASCLHTTGFMRFAGLTRTISESGSGHRLVTDGWYRIVRHPLYLFSIIFMLLNPVMTGQWLLLTALSLVYFIIGGIVEERRLIKEFGNDYLNYRTEVPFMLPRIRSGRNVP